MTDEPTRHVDVEPGGSEKHIYGPPGTGKTTYLSARIAATANARGRDNIVVASFTVAAAAELGSRGLGLPKSQLGTLHSLAYRMLDSPPVAAERLLEWNKRHPQYALSINPTGRTTLDDGQAPAEWNGATEGDELMSGLDTYRAKMQPLDTWRASVVAFEKSWSAWKRAEGVIDFTDMIEMAYQDVEVAPGNPEVGFFDEAQDFTPLELALIRKWGKRMERVILAGDDDQSIYGFKGASPEALLNPPLPAEDKHVLSQSYRVPRAVHRVAEHWIRRVAHREPKVYLPRDEEGEVLHRSLCYTRPSPFVDELAAAAERGTVMVLATCGYQLDQIKHEMRRAGLPFHNPYRRSRGDWNPLRPSRGTSSRDRLLAYLIADEREFGERSRLWTGKDIQAWAHVIKTSACMRKGSKTAIGNLPSGEVPFDLIAELFDDEAELDQAVMPDVEWFARNLLAGSRAGMEFPLTVARRRGATALLETPRVVIGTMHSVKGGQADTVFVIPDLSIRGAEQWAKQSTRDAVIRQFYVAMTRARQTLMICSPATDYHVPSSLLLAGRAA